MARKTQGALVDEAGPEDWPPWNGDEVMLVHRDPSTTWGGANIAF